MNQDVEIYFLCHFMFMFAILYTIFNGWEDEVLEDEGLINLADASGDGNSA